MVEELRRSMQRRLAGFALRQICDAQDFLGTVCYTDARGFIPEEIKRTVVRVNMAIEPCLRKVQKMASDRKALERSAWDKIVEFRELGYPRRVLRTACNYLGATTGERGWFEVRDQLGF